MDEKMKRIVKIVIYSAVVVLVAASILTAYVFTAFPKVSDPPVLQVHMTKEAIERGRHLAYHVMMCADCHSQRDFSKFSGPPHPGTEFAGGDVFDHSQGFPGRFVSANITPYGIGDWTDGELFRLITEGVTKDGKPIFPVMPYHQFGQLAREDVEAVIAYLRTLQPVETNHPESKADFPINIIMRTMPQRAALTEKPDSTDRIAFGRYVFTAAACADCHTNVENGKPVGPVGGGGREFRFPDGSIVRTSNITPHATGIAHHSRESFVALFKRYADSNFRLPDVRPGEFQTLMPWVMYAGMTEKELGAIYDYLQTLPPYENTIQRFTPITDLNAK